MNENPGRSRGPYAKTPARRQEILRTALAVFGELGYRGSSMRVIADRVGMSESGLLHHFGGKVELLLAVLEERDNLVRQAGKARPDFGPDLVATNTSQPGVVRLFATLSAEATDPDHPAHDYFVQRYAGIRSRTAARLAQGQADGELVADVDPALVAQLIMAVMDGLQIQWLLDPTQDMEAAYNLFHQRLVGPMPTPSTTPPSTTPPSAAPSSDDDDHQTR